MALPITIFLSRGQTVLSSSASIQGISFPVAGNSFGVIQQIWGQSVYGKAGDNVCFSQNDAIQMIINNVTYFLIEDSDILFIESPVAP